MLLLLSEFIIIRKKFEYQMFKISLRFGSVKK